jgi:Do/DeqQ family serine protease
VKSTAIAAGTTTPPPAKEKRVSPNNAAAPVDFPSIVERYGPAVVNIRAAAPEQHTSTPAPEAIDPDDPFSAFFRQAAAPLAQPSQESPPRAMSGIGSGFIISADGMILTTAHVIDQADDVTVRLTDRREFKATVLSVDAQSDVAIIQIDATKLPTVKLGDSSKVRVGEQVMTIGSPDSFQNTVTAGIVSATSRTLPDGGNFPFLQTDVAVNPDNSGGPVFNRAGEVVGIDVQVYVGADRYQSLTFAIPINLATKVRAQLQSQHTTTAGGTLGVEVQDVDPGLAGAFGLPRAAGALVIAVEPGTPAAASGLKPADVIVRIGDKTIDRSTDLAGYAAGLQPGTNVTLKVFRNRRPMTVRVNVGGSGESAAARPNEGGAADRLGLAMHPLTDGERRTTGLPQGLMVDGADGAAARAGIQPGDVVLSLNGTLVETQEEVAALAVNAGKKVALLIQRDHARSFVTVELR